VVERLSMSTGFVSSGEVAHLKMQSRLAQTPSHDYRGGGWPTMWALERCWRILRCIARALLRLVIMRGKYKAFHGKPTIGTHTNVSHCSAPASVIISTARLQQSAIASLSSEARVAVGEAWGACAGSASVAFLARLGRRYLVSDGHGRVRVPPASLLLLPSFTHAASLTMTVVLPDFLAVK
jgi:hypothetical protein